jgi:hypothetical protein
MAFAAACLGFWHVSPAFSYTSSPETRRRWVK